MPAERNASKSNRECELNGSIIVATAGIVTSETRVPEMEDERYWEFGVEGSRHLAARISARREILGELS